MTSSPATGSRLGAGTALPRVGAGRSGAAPLKNDNSRLFQQVLFWVGASLLPLGLVVIVLGWYGVANTPFGYDQESYMISGGFGGLALTFVGDGGIDVAAIPVTCGDEGVTMHRRDCSLVAHRTDLRPVGENTAGLVACRVCRP